ncbi:MAG: methyltransferase domain-containing protein [Leptospirales bacterium]|nr:methyltransferase domain-containing protein [Leptospirales bacterium]
MSGLRRFFVNLKKGTEYLNYGRDILKDWGAAHAVSLSKLKPSAAVAVYDIGCGHGTDIVNIRNAATAAVPSIKWKLEGIENFIDYQKECKSLGIKTYAVDLERDVFPGNNSSVDVLVANQVLEHTKEIFWIFAEAARLVKPGGRFLVGVPNLASLHNRLLLLFGEQPTAQQSLSAHVRGFTKPDFKKFAEAGGFFKLTAFRGSNFYPFPPLFAKPMARIFPTLAWGAFFNLERTEKKGDFLECLRGDENFLETPFYGSPQNPAKRRARK